MRKFVAAVWVFVLSITLVSTSYVADAKAQFHGEALLSIHAVATQHTTPESLAKFMWRSFAFEQDQSHFGKQEYWQTPDEFLSNQKGDCEDFALFAKTILTQNGIKAFLLNVYGSRYAHTVCVFVENGKYNVIDGTKVKRYNAVSLVDLMTQIYPHWKTGAIVDLSSDTRKGRTLKKFQR